MRISDRGWSRLALAFVLASAAGCPSPRPNGNGGDPPSAEVLALEVAAHDLVNAQRTANALPALIMRNDLREVARAHSEDMAARDFFDHVNPDGDDPFDRLDDAGIAFNNAGENIAFNQGFPNPAAVAVDGWMNSQGHRENILRSAFTHAGMGVAVTANGEHYFTQVFAGFSKDVPEGFVDVYYYGPIRMDAPTE